MTEDEMVGWHHLLDGHEFEQAPGVGDGQGSLACHSPWGLFQNFPQFVVIHTVKGFGIVNKAEVDVFLELSCFFNDRLPLLLLFSIFPSISIRVFSNESELQGDFKRSFC